MKSKNIFAIILPLLILSCVAKEPQKPEAAQTMPTIHKERKNPQEITSWAYWLQGPSIAALAESPYDLIVMDYSADGTDKKKFSAKDISVLHKFDKTVLCYFSIGEAEEYRFYWQKEWKDNPPNFLGPENPDWAANYKVKYWREDWWEIGLRPYLDRILEAGFDGVYLDIIDGYWFWHEQGVDITSTADDMVKLIKRIADYCRAKAGKDFIVCPQNGLGVINDCSLVYRDLYLKTVNMVGLESLLTNVHSKNDQKYRLEIAKEIADSSITILGVEYIDEQEYPAYLEQVKTLDFNLIPYGSAPDAALDTLTNFSKYHQSQK